MKSRVFIALLQTSLAIVLLVGCAQPKPSPAPPTIRIGSFNIRDFGPHKAANAAVMQALSDIVGTFDLLAVQEVSDTNGTGPKALLQQVNAAERVGEFQTATTRRAEARAFAPRSGTQAATPRLLTFSGLAPGANPGKVACMIADVRHSVTT